MVWEIFIVKNIKKCEHIINKEKMLEKEESNNKASFKAT